MSRSISAVASHPITGDDAALLSAFVARGDSAAFSELVQRHIHFVHGTALRQLGDERALVDDVTQAVFIILHKKANVVAVAAPALASWLHRTTCYAVANARKMANRRRYHEQVASRLREEVQMESIYDPGIISSLDEALASLPEKEKSAVVARYFQGKSASEIAASFGSTPQAAQKRIERAIEKLRHFFACKRHTLTLAAVAGLLSDVSTHQAPAGLIGVVQSSCVGNCTAIVSSIVTQTMKTILWLKLKLIATCVVVAVLIVVAGAAFMQLAHAIPSTGLQPREEPRVEAPADLRTQLLPTTAPADSVVIQGEWTVIDAWSRGQKAPADEIAKVTYQFKDATMTTLLDGQKKQAGRFELDPKASPRQFNMYSDANPNRQIPGIYELIDGQLKLYFDDRRAKRPSDFPKDPVSATGGKYWLLQKSSPANK